MRKFSSPPSAKSSGTVLPVEPFRKKSADGGLAGGGHADEHDVCKLGGDLAPHFQDLFALRACGRGLGIVPAAEEDACGFCLRRQHQQTARYGHPEVFRLLDETGAEGIEYGVEHSLEPREDGEVDGRRVGVREHADGGGVDDDFRFDELGDVGVVDFAAPRDDGDGGGAFAFCEGARGV